MAENTITTRREALKLSGAALCGPLAIPFVAAVPAAAKEVDAEVIDLTDPMLELWAERRRLTKESDTLGELSFAGRLCPTASSTTAAVLKPRRLQIEVQDGLVRPRRPVLAIRVNSACRDQRRLGSQVRTSD